MKRVLITGGTGFVGGHLVRRFCDIGWKVSILSRRLREGSDRQDVDFLKYDGTVGSVISALESFAPDVVVHLASLYIAEHSAAQVDSLVAGNILFGAQLAEAMSLRKVHLLVNAGTAWQNYKNSAYDPVNLYAATKQALEDILAYYRNAHRLRIITLKLFDTYGPGDKRPKLLAALRRSRNERMSFSQGRQRIDLVHIDDVVDAFVLAAERLLRGRVKSAETYAVSSGRPLTLRRIAAIYEQTVGCKLKIDWGARPYRTREVMAPWSKGRRLPGWNPKIALEKGLIDLEGIR